MNVLKSISSGHHAYGMSMNAIIDIARKSRSFEHVSEAALRGWFLGIAHAEVFGFQRRDTFCSPRANIIQCWPCKGKGWRGHGRTECDNCGGTGSISVKAKRPHSMGNSMTPVQNRLWRALLDDYAGGDKYLCAFYTAMYAGNISGVIYDINSKKKFPSFSRRNALLRLALTFGCTCPVNGEYVQPSDVEDYSNLCDYIYPLGFTASSKSECGKYGISVSPLSVDGKKAIARAVCKWRRMNIGPIVSEWVLAEVMKNNIFRTMEAA